MLLLIQTGKEESCTRYLKTPLMPKNADKKRLSLKSFLTCITTHAQAYGI